MTTSAPPASLAVATGLGGDFARHQSLDDALRLVRLKREAASHRHETEPGSATK